MLSIEDDFIEWKDKLLAELNEKFWSQNSSTTTTTTTSTVASGCQIKQSGDPSALVDPYLKTSHWKIVVPGVATSKNTSTEVEKKVKVDVSNPVLVPIVENRELRQPFTQRMCRHISFDISSATGLPVVNYEAGDHLGVFPKNTRDIVVNVAKRLGVDLSSTFSIVYPEEDDCSKNTSVYLALVCSIADEALSGHNPGASWTSVLPEVCSVDEALTTYCDLTSVSRSLAISFEIQHLMYDTRFLVALYWRDSHIGLMTSQKKRSCSDLQDR